MTEAWPTDLPQLFNQGDYREGIGQDFIRSEMDVGPAKMRRRSSAVPDPMSGSMDMTDDQLTDFIFFFKTTLIGGTEAFTFPDPRGGSDLLVRFVKPPDWNKPIYSHWRVSLSLEILP